MNPNAPRPRNRRSHHHIVREARADERRRECLALRVEGLTIRQIAQRVGLSVSTVHGYIKEALAHTHAATAELASQLRENERGRLEAIIAAWMPTATGQKAKDSPAMAVEVIARAQADLRALYQVPLSAPAPEPKAVPAQAEAAGAPVLTPEQAAHENLMDALIDDTALNGARFGFLPTGSYDDAWDTLEADRPGAYRPAPEVEAHLREHWKDYVPAAV